MDLRNGALSCGAGELQLSTMELALLGYVSARPGRVVARQELLTEVWGYALGVASRAPDDTMRRLRLKVERDPQEPWHLRAVHGSGYVFTPLAPLVSDALDYGHVRLDLDLRRVAWQGGREEALTEREAALLSALAQVDRGVMDRPSLLRKIAGLGVRSKVPAVDTLVQRLRRRIERDPASPRLLLSVRGRGYRLVRPPPPPAPDGFPDARGAAFGRTAELLQLDQHLSEPGIPCIVGPGGSGKTTLAMAAARRAQGWQSVDSVFFCDLSALSDPALVAQAIADRISPGLALRARPLEGLARVLRQLGTPLLVLDCLDRLVPGGVDLLVTLSSLAPRAHLLLTSQVVPTVERVLFLGSLSVSEAVRLFRDRAARSPEPDDPALPELVRKLDCTPLAVELAAGRSDLLTPTEMLRDLDARLDIVSADPAAVARQASLRDCIAWSWDLLPTSGQLALTCCGLFGGPFLIEDFAATIGREAEEAEPILKGLIAVSLVIPVSLPLHGDEPFYRLLDTVSQFACERLDASPHRAEWTARFVAAMADRAELLYGEGINRGDARSERLRVAAFPNALAALECAVDPWQAARLVHPMASLFRQSGQTPLLAEKLEALLEELPSAPRSDRSERGFAAADLAFVMLDRGRTEAAEPLLDEAIAIAERTGDARLLSNVQLSSSRAVEARGDHERTQAHLQSALILRPHHGLVSIEAAVNNALGGFAARRGQLEESMRRHRGALALLPNSGFFRLRGMLTHNLAGMELERGRLAPAEYHFRRARELARRGDRPKTILKSTGALGLIAWCTGRRAEGRRAIAEAIERCRGSRTPTRRRGFSPSWERPCSSMGMSSTQSCCSSAVWGVCPAPRPGSSRSRSSPHATRSPDGPWKLE